MSDLERLLPTPIDPSTRPDYARMLAARALPFSMDDPFIFHVLTTVPQVGGEDILLDLMRRGAAIVPRAEVAGSSWGGGRSLIFGRDVAAGDDKYVFTTPCHPFSGSEPTAMYAPAVVFRLSAVMDLVDDVGFRVGDLDWEYQNVVDAIAGEPADYEEEDGDDDYEGDGEVEEDEDSTRLRYEAEQAELVREELQAIAECGTQYDADAAAELVKLYAMTLGAFRDTPNLVADDDPRRLMLYKAAQRLFPAGDACEWLAEEHGSQLRSTVGSIEARWERVFGGPRFRKAGGFFDLFHADRADRPEFLVGGHLPLCEAEFYRDERQRWVPVPAEVCRTGRMVANPPVYIPG